MLGKFMPVHCGHLELIREAASRCRNLIVLVCTQSWEPIDGELRLGWVRACVEGLPNVEVRHCTAALPYRDLPSHEISRIWGEFLLTALPEVEVIFTSEAYGDELARVMGIEHVGVGLALRATQIRASQIRQDPFRYWHRIPEVVRPHFVRRICLFGPESVGKSTVAERLARHFRTTFVPEVGRTLIADSRRCTYEDLLCVAEEHARETLRRLPQANKLLFCDTDLLTTRAYSRFLFGRELEVAPWIQEANRYDLHLFCDTDLPYVQDGTRLGPAARPAQRAAFLHQLEASGYPFEVISGNMNERTASAVEIVERRFLGSA